MEPRSDSETPFRFQIASVVHPDRCEVLTRLYGHRVLEGRIVGLCDGVERAGQYAVIEFAGLDEPLIVECGPPAARGPGGD